MSKQSGLWGETNYTFMRNLPSVGVYVGAMSLIAIAQEYMSSNSGLSFAQTMFSALLAIPAHLSILKGIDGNDAIFHEATNKKMMTFALHAFGLGVLCFLPAIAFVIVCLTAGIDTTLVFSLAAFVLLISTAFVFARWGTVLPAIVMDESKTLAAASARSRLSFRYAFPRLLLSFGLLTIAIFIPIVGIALAFEVGEKIFPSTGGVDLPLVAAILMAIVIGAYQVIMTSVVLSRSYLQFKQTNLSELSVSSKIAS